MPGTLGHIKVILLMDNSGKGVPPSCSLLNLVVVEVLITLN